MSSDVLKTVCLLLFFLRCDARRPNLRMRAFTPGPSSTTLGVRTALANDVQYDERLVLAGMKYVVDKMNVITALPKEKYYTLPVPGSGIYATEGCIRHFTPKGGKVLVLTNGYFGDRIIKICTSAGIDHHVISWQQGDEMNIDQVESHLKEDANYTTVTIVHYETSTTMLNPVEEIARLIAEYMPTANYIVDAVASVGCFHFNAEEWNPACVLTMPAKCLQGYFGLATVHLNREKFFQNNGTGGSYVVDLVAQKEGFDETGRPLFSTSPQKVMSTKAAIEEHFREGIENKVKRYRSCRRIVRKGFINMGWVPFLGVEDGTDMATTFYIPTHIFNYTVFQYLLEKSGNFLHRNDFGRVRVGHIGDITARDCREFLVVVKTVLNRMNVDVPFPPGPFKTKENSAKWVRHHAIP